MFSPVSTETRLLECVQPDVLQRILLLYRPHTVSIGAEGKKKDLRWLLMTFLCCYSKVPILLKEFCLTDYVEAEFFESVLQVMCRSFCSRSSFSLIIFRFGYIIALMWLTTPVVSAYIFCRHSAHILAYQTLFGVCVRKRKILFLQRVWQSRTSLLNRIVVTSQHNHNFFLYRPGDELTLSYLSEDALLEPSFLRQPVVQTTKVLATFCVARLSIMCFTISVVHLSLSAM